MNTIDPDLSPLMTPETETATVRLAVHVSHALERYFTQLKGHDTADLYHLVLSEVEKPLFETVLAECGYNQSKAAKMLGLSRSTLRKKLELYALIDS